MTTTAERRRRRRLFIALTGAFVGGLAAGAVVWRRQIKNLIVRSVPYDREPANLSRPVLIVNRWSGDGRAERTGLVEAAQQVRIETIMLERGDDLAALARNAIAAGADAIGMAGGDGSLGIVAGVAVEKDVPFFCVPVGTRNHFALDLGLDRDDPVSALDALRGGDEIRIDYGVVGTRVFLNNVSFGIYADAVHRDGYRAEKDATVAAVLAEYIADAANQPGIRYETPNGVKHDRAPLLLVSNNPYVLTGPPDFGRRIRLDAGQIGVGAVTSLPKRTDAASVGLAELRALHEWEARSLTLESDDLILAGVDGEALSFDSPLKLSIRPRGLRVVVPAETSPGFVPPKDVVAARLLDLADLGGVERLTAP